MGKESRTLNTNPLFKEFLSLPGHSAFLPSFVASYQQPSKLLPPGSTQNSFYTIYMTKYSYYQCSTLAPLF